MANIQFVRVMREKRLARSKPIYDYNVMIDGEHRATFERDFASGYALYETNGRLISSRYYRNSIITKSDFHEVVIAALPKIPSAKQQQWDRDYNEARLENSHRIEAENNRLAALQREIMKEALADYIAKTVDGEKHELAIHMLELRSGRLPLVA